MKKLFCVPVPAASVLFLGWLLDEVYVLGAQDYAKDKHFMFVKQVRYKYF